jgi:flavin-binding protein dodecin
MLLGIGGRFHSFRIEIRPLNPWPNMIRVIAPVKLMTSNMCIVRTCKKNGRKKVKDHVYKIIELAGSSHESIEKAIENAIERASKSVRELRWFEVIQTRGHIEDGKVAHYQVVIKAGFSLEG